MHFVGCLLMPEYLVASICLSSVLLRPWCLSSTCIREASTGSGQHWPSLSLLSWGIYTRLKCVLKAFRWDISSTQHRNKRREGIFFQKFRSTFSAYLNVFVSCDDRFQFFHSTTFHIVSEIMIFCSFYKDPCPFEIPWGIVYITKVG